MNEDSERSVHGSCSKRKMVSGNLSGEREIDKTWRRIYNIPGRAHFNRRFIHRRVGEEAKRWYHLLSCGCCGKHAQCGWRGWVAASFFPSLVWPSAEIWRRPGKKGGLLFAGRDHAFSQFKRHWVGSEFPRTTSPSSDQSDDYRLISMSIATISHRRNGLLRQLARYGRHWPYSCYGME